MVPNTWYGGFPNALSHVMVQEYIARYGGTASDINGDVAEAYSAGQVMADAVDSVGLSQKRIIGFLHSRGTQFDTVQGLAQWGKYVKGKAGENLKASAFVFQWQAPDRFVQVLSPRGSPPRTSLSASRRGRPADAPLAQRVRPEAGTAQKGNRTVR